MDRSSVLSAASHVIEPADLWSKRIDQHYRDRAPRVEKGVGETPGECFVCEDLDPFPVSGFAVAGVHPDDYGEKLLQGYAGVRPSGWDPAARIEDQDVDHICGEGPLSEPGDDALRHRRRGPPRRVLSRIQRLDGGIL